METKEVITEITDRIQKSANVKAVFGDPIREGSVTLIPVARVVIRGGGGGGRDRSRGDSTSQSEAGSGIGLGLNIISTPVGYIKTIQDKVEFQPITDRNKAISFISIAAALSMLGLFKAIGSRR